jgi:hypothetical protein
MDRLVAAFTQNAVAPSKDTLNSDNLAALVLADAERVGACVKLGPKRPDLADDGRSEFRFSQNPA